MSRRLTPDILVPGWIVTVGIGFLAAPPLGIAASLALFVVAVILVPAAIVIGLHTLLPVPIPQ